METGHLCQFDTELRFSMIQQHLKSLRESSSGFNYSVRRESVGLVLEILKDCQATVVTDRAITISMGTR